MNVKNHAAEAHVPGWKTMTILGVSARFALSPDTLRYDERVGLSSDVRRTKIGVRNDTEEDCGWIEFIKRMHAGRGASDWRAD